MRSACLLLIGVLAAGAAWAEDDPLAEAKSFLELGKKLVETGTDDDNAAQVKEGLAKLAEARKRFRAALAKPGLSDTQKNRIQTYLLDVESRIDWYAPTTPREAAGKGAPAEADVRVPELRKGERLGAWCGRVRALYDETDDPAGRAALARGMAQQAGVLALGQLFDLFRHAAAGTEREGVHEALALVGTSRVSNEMARYARPSKRKHWGDALEVVYLCLEKPERLEPERPFLRAVRAFHEMKDYELSLEILRHLDRMGTPGVAALGEVIYVDDFGHHERTIQMLSKKRDRRAVPPLCFKMNRFKFEYRVQMPAHRALLAMGWYAVPELIARLDDKAAGIWISWTLRKISGETMGTDKRKWHDWWKSERLRHPELFEKPEEAAAPAPVTGKPGPAPK